MGEAPGAGGRAPGGLARHRKGTSAPHGGSYPTPMTPLDKPNSFAYQDESLSVVLRIDFRYFPASCRVACVTSPVVARRTEGIR
jgi:hypothetical protein